MERVRQALELAPFKPFTLCLADGSKVPVLHRECIAISPDNTELSVYDLETKLHVIYPHLIAQVELRGKAKSKRGG
jgi:hypothetical protein